MPKKFAPAPQSTVAQSATPDLHAMLSGMLAMQQQLASAMLAMQPQSQQQATTPLTADLAEPIDPVQIMTAQANPDSSSLAAQGSATDPRKFRDTTFSALADAEAQRTRQREEAFRRLAEAQAHIDAINADTPTNGKAHTTDGFEGLQTESGKRQGRTANHRDDGIKAPRVLIYESAASKMLPDLDADGQPVYTLSADGTKKLREKKQTVRIEEEGRELLRDYQSRVSSLRLAVLTDDQIAILRDAGSPASNSVGLEKHVSRSTGNIGFGTKSPLRVSIVDGSRVYELLMGQMGSWLMAQSVRQYVK